MTHVTGRHSGSKKLPCALVHAGDVEEEGPTPNPSPNERRIWGGVQNGEGRRRHLVCVNEGEAGGGEHAGLGVDGLAEVLGTDTRVVTAMLGDDTVDMHAVGRDEAADIVGGEVEEALNAVLLLGLQGDAALTFEQGVQGPGGTPDDTRGIGAGGHGVEVLVELEDGDGLGLIDGEEQVGGGAKNVGTGFTGKELELGLAKRVQVALGGFPEMARANTGLQGGFDVRHVNLGLRFEGGGDGDDAAADAGVAVKQPGEEVGLELVLAGLARQNDDEGEAALVDDRVLYGAGDLDLIRIEMDAASERPGDGGTADGVSKTLGEVGGRLCHGSGSKEKGSFVVL